MKTLSIMIAAAVLTGCATQPAAPPLKTASGRPEIIINRPLSQARGAIVATQVGAGSKLVTETQSSLTFTVPLTGFGATLLYGTQLSPTPHGRATFALVPVGERTRVFVSAEIVSNAGTAFESVTPTNDPKTYQALQKSLELIKAEAEK